GGEERVLVPVVVTLERRDAAPMHRAHHPGWRLGERDSAERRGSHDRQTDNACAHVHEKPPRWDPSKSCAVDARAIGTRAPRAGPTPQGDPLEPRGFTPLTPQQR